MNQLMVLKWIAEAIDKADALSKVGEAERKEESVVQKRATPPTEKKVVVLNNLDRAIQLVDGIVKNCGAGSAGSPGFEPGNTCAGGGGGGGGAAGGGGRADTFEEVSARHDAKVDKEEREERAANARHEADTADEIGPPKDKYKPGEAPASGLLPPEPHDVGLPKNKRRLMIDESNEAARQMGYEVESKTDTKPPWSITHTVTDANGNSVQMTTDQFRNFVYANAANPKKPAARTNRE